jgi:hypothetical protein
MIIHCPSCLYSRKPEDTAPVGTCPGCKIVFEKFLSQRGGKQTVRQGTRPTTTNESAPTPSAVLPAEQKPKVTECPTCRGMVAYGIKSCPHCGMSKPAPKPPTTVTGKHLLIAAGVLAFILMSAANNDSNRRQALSSDDAVMLCAKEIGISANSSQTMSMQDLRSIDSCLNRHGFRTKR